MDNSSINLTVKKLRILYPLWVVVGILGIMYIPNQLIETGNNQLTAENISANELLFRFGITARIITQLLFIAIPLLLYKLFRSINVQQATLMVVLGLLSIPIALYNETNQMAILSYLDQPEIIRSYLDSYNRGLIVAMIFWGLWLFPLGQLVYNSNYFPKFLGVLLVIGGVGYMLGALIEILFPEVSLLISILEYLTFGEVIFILWFALAGAKIKTHVPK